MARQSVLWFYPEKIGWIGVAILGGVAGLALPLLFDSSPFTVDSPLCLEKEKEAAPLKFSLGLSDQGPQFPLFDFLSEMTFSLCPSRPDGKNGEQRLLLRLKKSGEAKQIVLPCRIDLESQKDKLVFSLGKSLFWLELSQVMMGQIEGRGYITSLGGEKIETGTFLATVQECPIQSAQEFVEGSPFRQVAEARWWGKDLFRTYCEDLSLKSRDSKLSRASHVAQHADLKESAVKGRFSALEEMLLSSAERLEIGSDFFELKENDWLVWGDKGWQKSQVPEQNKPIVRIQGVLGKSLILEGWDLERYIRICLNPATGPLFKTKGEELFSAIRIRSEKQISCMLEKQCMVLKTGDWVLKANGRWKILRKKEEREAFLKGKVVGEMFVFEQIQAKQGQKVIHGRLFNPGRTQAISVELAVQSTRKTGEKGGRKGRL